MTLHPKHEQWIELRGLDPSLAGRFGLETVNRHGKAWLRLPYLDNGREVNAKYRRTGEKEHMMEPGAPLLWWNLDCLRDEAVASPSTPVVITEGEWDALVAIQCGWAHTLSVPNGADERAADAELTPDGDAKRFQFFWRDKALTDPVARFIIATDGDGPGRMLAQELVRRLGPHRCLFVTYPDGCKDLNDILEQHGVAGVTAALKAAKPYPVRGLYTLDDFPEPPPARPYNVRLPLLFDAWPIVPGTFSVVTGYAGQGKTSLILACMADLMAQGVGVAIGSFETMPKPILHATLRGHLCGQYSGHLSSDQIAAADAVLADRLRIIAQMPGSDDDDMTLDDVLDLAATAVMRDGVRVILLDPWNEIEHKRGRDESETEYTGRAIRMMKRFARQYDVALILVAHPRKPDMTGGSAKPPTLYDISGSANFANKADYGVIIYRSSKDRPLVKLDVTKVRMGLPGVMGSYELEWDWQRSRYDRAQSLHDMEA
jgi:twinkle protein